jgi:hypothetical protein
MISVILSKEKTCRGIAAMNSGHLKYGASERAGFITLFLSGDVMTGRGIDQILAHPGDPACRFPGGLSRYSIGDSCEKTEIQSPDLIRRSDVV